MAKYFKETLIEMLKDPEFKKEWDELEPQYQIIESLIEARNENNITQKELSKLTGITQSDISKIENGNANPSIKTLQKIAKALNKKLIIKFI